MSEKILVTGAAGFIGFHLSKHLLSKGFTVIGLDNLNDYYSVKLKEDRLKELGIEDTPYNKFVQGNQHGKHFHFIKLDLHDKGSLQSVFENFKIDQVCNLAAQAGVRYSLENPMAYIDSNIVGFVNLLEAMRYSGVKKLVYASSSSVYGMNEKVPFSTEDNVDYPVSLYAATKKSNELIAHTYAHLYGIQAIGLRFFTVYGPWGRPDMAMFLFTDATLNNNPIKVFNKGKLSRDFTYIDDIVNGIIQVLTKKQKKNYALYNIGNGNPVKLMDFISTIEKQLGIKAKKEMLPMQPGDVEKTWADTKDLETDYQYKPSTSIEEGVSKFLTWFKNYYDK